MNKTWTTPRPPRPGAAEPDRLPDFAETVPMGLHAGSDEPVWNESSFDLRYGMDMFEQPIDTLPGELRGLFPGK
ncbi:MAG TPA: hypothetical protein VLI72_03660 [Methylibium sp.]|nr:hypothetical protein [Methylibium sp.]